MKCDYLKWMAENTPTQYCNDDALMPDIEDALASGAVGCTSNPPLSFEALTTTPELMAEDVAKIEKGLDPDENALQHMMCVVKMISNKLMPLYEKTNGEYGYVRAQVQPKASDNVEAMLYQGKKLAGIAKNVMIKIPGTKAGLVVLEELAALGIPTNPTVCTTVPQMIAVAEAYERGAARAKAAGLKPAKSTAAMVMGRLQDYLTGLNEERKLGLTKEELDWAALACCKRACKIYDEKGYNSMVMPAAFRAPMQVEQLVGCKCEMTIHPKVQKQVAEADAAGTIKRENGYDKPINMEAVEKVMKLIPEYAGAYEPDGLTVDQFDTYGAVLLTLDGFDKTGWQKLRTL